MFDLATGLPIIDPEDDPELLIDKLSVEIATMKNCSEEYLYRRDGGNVVVLRSGSFSMEDARRRLENTWMEVYHKYIRSIFNVELTEQVALTAANDKVLAEATLRELRKGGGNTAAFWLTLNIPRDFWNSILSSCSGMGGVCWLTVARELPYQ